MTPKEKAEYLINQYLKLCVEKDYHQDFKLIQAKRGALIAVDELIEEAYFTDGYYDRQEYWQEVKQQIQNL